MGRRVRSTKPLRPSSTAATCDEIDLSSLSAQIPNMLGWLHHQLGDFGRALTLDREGVAVALQANLMTAEVSARLNICQDLLELDGAETALQELRKIEQRMDEGDFGYHGWRWRLRLLHIQASSHLRLGDAVRVLALAEEGAALAQRTSARKYIALNHELAGAALAQTERWTQAIHELEQAIRVADEVGCRPIGWHVRARLARIYQYLEDEERAKAWMVESEETVKWIADQVGDASLRGTFLSFVNNSISKTT